MGWGGGVGGPVSISTYRKEPDRADALRKHKGMEYTDREEAGGVKTPFRKAVNIGRRIKYRNRDSLIQEIRLLA